MVKELEQEITIKYESLTDVLKLS